MLDGRCMLNFTLLAGLSEEFSASGRVAYVLQLAPGFDERALSGRAYCGETLVCSSSSSGTQGPIAHSEYWPLLALSRAHNEPEAFSRATRTCGEPVSCARSALSAASEAKNKSGPCPEGRKAVER